MQDCKDLDVLVVTTTVGTDADARRLARGLVEQRLAACVQVDAGVTSIYRWDGKVCEDAECRLTIKTARDTEPALRAWLLEQHPYDLPQYVVVATAVAASYGEWVLAQTRVSPRAT